MRARVLVAVERATIRDRVADIVDRDFETVIATSSEAIEQTLATEALDVAVVEVAWLTAALVDDAGAPVVALVAPDDDAALALQLGCADVLRADATAAEISARVAAAARLARAEQDVRAARVELADATRTDHLTGLANRRHLDEHLAMAASAARRHRQAMSLLLVDVDHLKRVNDAIGHNAGDAVLRALATRIAHVLRGEDMAGRWGGDEILVVAPSTDIDGAWRLGERIRDAASDAPVVLDGGRDVLITVSIGCSTGPGDDVEMQLRQAEAALDQARAAGRNRVVVTDAAIMS